jgi:hypothetical protein
MQLSDFFTPNDLVAIDQATDLTLTAAHLGKVIRCTAGLTLTPSAAATLGNGWFCWIKNASSGVVIVDPTGAETVDSIASVRLYGREGCLLQSNGTSFRTLGRSSGLVAVERRAVTAVGTINFETAYADPELDAVIFEARNLLTSASSAIIRGRVKKSGAYLANGTYPTTHGTNGASDTVTANNTYFPLAAETGTSADPWTGRVETAGVQGTIAAAQRFSARGLKAASSPVRTEMAGHQTTAAAVQGFQFLTGAGNFIAQGEIICYGLRSPL